MQSILGRLDSRTQLRVRITLQAALEYVATGAFLALFCARGTIDLSVVGMFAIVAVCNNALFLGCIASGVSKRFQDPSMTAIQMFASCGRDLIGMLLAPPVWYVFAFNLFIALPFGSLQFGRRAFATSWLLVALGLGAVFALLPRPMEIPVRTTGDAVLLWTFLTAGLARLMLFNARISDLRNKLRNKITELDQATQRLAAMATQDELTGLHNRREFNRRLAAECERAARTGSPYFVAILDADNFKQVNDRYGHAEGDWVLRALAELLLQAVRQNDLVARLGGEEFGLLLCGCDEQEAEQALHRLRRAVQDHPWGEHAAGLSVTVSIGAALGRATAASAELSLREADLALYQAKDLGRNRVQFFHASGDAALGSEAQAGRTTTLA